MLKNKKCPEILFCTVYNFTCKNNLPRINDINQSSTADSSSYSFLFMTIIGIPIYLVNYRQGALYNEAVCRCNMVPISTSSSDEVGVTVSTLHKLQPINLPDMDARWSSNCGLINGCPSMFTNNSRVRCWAAALFEAGVFVIQITEYGRLSSHFSWPFSRATRDQEKPAS